METESDNVYQGRELVVMMRGLPGSGKSYYAKQLIASLPEYVNSCIVSADDYFVDAAGNYQWNGSKIHDAHHTCFDMFLRALWDRIDVIVVDNTNIRLDEMQPYVMVTSIADYDLQVHQFVPSESMLETIIERCVHNVPADKVKRRFRQWQSIDEAKTIEGPAGLILADRCTVKTLPVWNVKE